ncbi:MAG: DUF4097 family beta strand repeat-containing protein [Oscillospiraceae bacterium]
MSTKIKVFLCMAGVMLIFGIVGTFAARGMGASEISCKNIIWDKNGFKQKTITYNINDETVKDENGKAIFDFFESPTQSVGKSGVCYSEVVAEEIETSSKFDDIKTLKLDLGGVDVTILEGDEFKVETENKNDVKWKLKGNEFTVYTNNTVANFIDDHINIYLPKSDFKKIYMDIGAGKIVCEMPLVCDEFDVSVGVGEFQMKNLTAIKNTDIEVGMGNFNLEKGVITGNADIECAAGNVEMQIAGDENHYDYDIDCALGNVKFGDKKYNGIADDNNKSHHSKNLIDIECGMGNVTVNFTGK